MTRSPHRLAPLALVALSALAGCQDYNFSPVNQCLIQPGTERVTLSDISTADILFVVDDSGSMGGEQQSLAASFGAFVTNLTNTNRVRVQNGLEPIDFHIAITTTSVFLNRPVPGGATCQSSCGGAAGQVCCETLSNQPLTAPRTCSVEGATCTAPGGPWTCRSTNVGLSGELTCGDAAGVALRDPVTCPTLGQACGEIQQRYAFTHGPRRCGSNGDCRNGDTCRSTCTSPPTGGTYCCNAGGTIDQLQCNPGVADQTGAAPFGEYTLYPRGNFVKARTSSSGAPPRVIHFDKDLFCNRDANGCVCTGAGAPAVCDPPVVNTTEIDKRIAWFNANVLVGTCGSGQEQGLEASRRAIQKALRLDGQSQPADVLPAEWPHPASKLVTVWVGDEDDCSSPEDASQGVIFSPSTDACALEPESLKRYDLDDYSSFLIGLGRPLATGFIVSATGIDPNAIPPQTNPNDCVDAICQASLCVDPTCTSGPGLCGGQGAGSRYVELAGSFGTLGSDVVVGSICSQASASTPPDFSSILDRVAEVVKQPTGLQLPTQPAAAALTILRIVAADGKTRKTCTEPAPIGTTDLPDPITGAVLNDYDWWFINPNDLTDPNGQKPTSASRYIQLNRNVQRCVANPGETYSADYLGLVPIGGCDPLVLDPASGQPKACVDALGLRKTPWVCQKEVGAMPTDMGTCLCGG